MLLVLRLFFIILFILSSNIGLAQECINFIKTSKIKNINSGKISPIFKNESLISGEAVKRFYRLNYKKNSYLIYKNKTRSSVTCPEIVGQCLVTKKNVTLRDSVFKNHRKVPISNNTPLKIISVLPRNNKVYYRLYDSKDEFLWISEKQKNRLFNLSENCEVEESQSQAKYSRSDDYVDDLEEHMSEGESLSDQIKNEIDEAKPTAQKSSSFYFNFGYGLGLDSSFLDSFTDNIADPNQVKSDPDPIITGNEGSAALFIEAHYRRTIFKPQIFVDLGLGYRMENYLLIGKDNPASASSVIRLRDLADKEIKIDLSILQIGAGLYYKLFIFNSIDLYTGLAANLNYYLSDEIRVDRRKGPNKLTEEPSILKLSAIDVSVHPEIQMVTSVGLAFHLRYNYSFNFGGYPALALGYSF